MSNGHLRVAICGGGIGGLCLAVFLARHAHLKVDLYEAAGQFREIGAGVMIWSRTWRILERLGLADQFARCAHAPPTGDIGVGFDFRRSDKPEEGFSFQLVQMPYGCIRFHRAEFLDVFVNNLPPGVAHFGKKLTGYTRSAGSAGLQLTFADGSTAVCDILIGADGIKSTVRAQMCRELFEQSGDNNFLDPIEPVWTGTMAFRGLIDAKDVPRIGDKEHRTVNTPMMYCGKGRHVVSYSIARGDIVNVVTFVSQPERFGEQFNGDWVVDCSQDELLQAYDGWEPEVDALLKCIRNPTKWAIHQLRPLPAYHHDRVVLLGDAAHAMSPHMGAGAGQAIEDAYVLSELLRVTQTHDLSALLKAYEKVRLPASQSVVEGSYENGMMYEFNGPHGENYSELGPALQGRWTWLDEPTLDATVDQALRTAENMRSI